MLRVMRVNKITRGITHFSIYLTVVSTRDNVVMGYHSGRKEKVVKGEGNPVIVVTGATLSECVKKMYDMVQRLGLREDELLIIDEHNSIATGCQVQAPTTGFQIRDTSDEL